MDYIVYLTLIELHFYLKFKKIQENLAKFKKKLKNFSNLLEAMLFESNLLHLSLKILMFFIQNHFLNKAPGNQTHNFKSQIS